MREILNFCFWPLAFQTADFRYDELALVGGSMRAAATVAHFLPQAPSDEEPQSQETRRPGPGPSDSTRRV